MAAIQSLSTAAIIALVNAGAWPPTFAVVTGNLAAINSAVAVDVHNASNVAISLVNTGGAADILGVSIFEASVDSTNGTDGNWVPIRAARTSDATVETGRAAASLAGGTANPYSWQANVAGFTWFRVRLSTAVTATAVDTYKLARSAYGNGIVGFAGTMTTTITGAPAAGGALPVSAVITGAPAAGGALPVSISGTVLIDEANTVLILPSNGSAFKLLTVVTSINATVIKGTPGSLMEFTFFNGSAAAATIKIYDKATTPAPSTDTALLLGVWTVAAGVAISVEFGPLGKRAVNGLSLAITLNAALADATNVAAAGGMVSATYQ